jgi:hypothetical protein
MTKQHYKLVAKLYAANVLYNTECAFEPNNLLNHTTEDQMQIVAEECRRIGEKMTGKHSAILGAGSITEIAEYVENLYYE